MNSFRFVICIVLSLSCLVGLIFSAGNKFYYKTFPKWVHPCYFDDPKFDNCMVKNFQDVINEFYRAGFPELRLLKADPLKIDRIEFLSGNDGPVDLNIEANDISVYGLGNAKVLENRFNRDRYGWYEKIYVSEASLTGMYKATGKVLIVPINGHGKCQFNLKNMTVELISESDLIEKDGHLFNNITAFKVKYDLGHLSFQLENLFEGNPALSSNISNYLSANWREIAPAFEPVLQEAFQSVFDLFVNKIVSAVPQEFWLPETSKYYPPKKN